MIRFLMGITLDCTHKRCVLRFGSSRVVTASSYGGFLRDVIVYRLLCDVLSYLHRSMCIHIVKISIL